VKTETNLNPQFGVYYNYETRNNTSAANAHFAYMLLLQLQETTDGFLAWCSIDINTINRAQTQTQKKTKKKQTSKTKGGGYLGS
jgi:hypothetical protein